MASRQGFRIGHSAPAAIFVRTFAFCIAAIGVFTIPFICVAVSTGHLGSYDGLGAAGLAVLMIAAAAVMVRPFDPLRQSSSKPD